MSTVPFETILGVIALEIAEAEKAIGDAKCTEDTLAAHLCGRVSGLLDILDRLSGLQDPSRAWAAGLVVAEHREAIIKVRREAADVAAKKAAMRKIVELLGSKEEHYDPHMN